MKPCYDVRMDLSVATRRRWKLRWGIVPWRSDVEGTEVRVRLVLVGPGTIAREETAWFEDRAAARAHGAALRDGWHEEANADAA